jgi:hypothetical protein
MDVLGWLPGAGFEVDRKVLSTLFARTLHRPNTPGDTPRMDALDSRRHVVGCNTGRSPIYEGLPLQKRCRTGRRPTPEITGDHCATAIRFV